MIQETMVSAEYCTSCHLITNLQHRHLGFWKRVFRTLFGAF
jgi:hypothetical protein